MNEANLEQPLPEVGLGDVRGAVALFNDTGDVAHVGCLAVSDANRRLLRRSGLALRRTFYHREWHALAGMSVLQGIEAALALPDLKAAFAAVDAVVINGEGTIHHGGGRHLLAIAGAAQRSGLQTHVFNAVLQDLDDEHGVEVLRGLTGLVVRDRYSAEWLTARDVPHEMGWDSILEAGFAAEAVHDFSGRVVITECHPDLAARLQPDLDHTRVRFGEAVVEYRIEDQARCSDWRHALADLQQARLLVTARHHAIYIALMAGIPFVPLVSNTWKIEGLLRRFEVFPDWFARLEGSIDDRIDWAMGHPEAFVAAAGVLKAARPLEPFRAISPHTQRRPPCDQAPTGSAQADEVLRAARTVATGGKVLCVGASETGAVRALRGAGFDVRVVEPAATTAGPRAVRSLGDLAVGDDAGPLVVAGAWAEEMDEAVLPAFLAELARVAADTVLMVVSGRPSPQAAPAWGMRGREWWEARLLSAGLRRHPATLRLVAYEDLEHESHGFVLPMQKVPRDAAVRFTLEGLRAERDLHMDMLREAGRRSDAHLARYDLAATYVRPGDRVIDAACGLGYGSAMLWDLTEATEVRGFDLGENVVRYAEAHFLPARSGVSFVCADATELPGIADASVDCVVSFETMEHLEHPDRFVDAVARVLKPGGRLICSIPNEWVDETGRDPNPYHLHVFDLDRLVATCSRRLLIEDVYMQSAGGPNHRFRTERTLRRVPWPPGASSPVPRDAEWWILVGMLDPVAGAGVPYKESVFPSCDPTRPPHAIAFARDYDNPWLVHSMVMGPFRARSKRVLEDIVLRAWRAARRGSADAGAALCVLAYQLLGGDGIDPGVRAEVIASAQDYITSSDDSAHALRWRISLQFALALVAQQDGRWEDAESLFRECSRADFMRFGPHLGTKCSEACFHAGRMALLRGDLERAEADWRAVFDVVARLPWTDPDSLLVNRGRPACFEFGDGLREITAVADNASRCANGLRVLAHIRAGRRLSGVAWDRSFQTVQAELVAGAAARAWETRVLRSKVVELASRNDQLQQRLVELGERHAALAARLRRRRHHRGRSGMTRVVIFGAGDGGRRVWEALSVLAVADVVGFVDNDSRKHAHAFLGLEVRAPEWLCAGGFDLIVVASVYASEIVPQVRALGVDPAAIVVPKLASSDSDLRQELEAALPPAEVPAAATMPPAVRVCIFGTGQGGTKVWEALMALDHVEPTWFADNDSRKHGQRFLGLEVVAPAQLPVIAPGRIVIASMHRQAIRAQLIAMGFEGSQLVSPDVTASFPRILEDLTSALPADSAP